MPGRAPPTKATITVPMESRYKGQFNLDAIPDKTRLMPIPAAHSISNLTIMLAAMPRLLFFTPFICQPHTKEVSHSLLPNSDYIIFQNYSHFFDVSFCCVF